MHTLESAKINQETMLAMKKASDALKTIHGDLYALSGATGCMYLAAGV